MTEAQRRVFDTPIRSQFGIAVAGRVLFKDLSKAIIPLGSSENLETGLNRDPKKGGRVKKIVHLLKELPEDQLNVTEQWHVSIETDYRPGNKSVDIVDLLSNAKSVKVLDGGGRWTAFQKLGWFNAPIQVVVYINPTRFEELLAIYTLNFRRTPMNAQYSCWVHASMAQHLDFEECTDDHLYAEAAMELAHSAPLDGFVKFHDDSTHSAKLLVAHIFKGIEQSERAVKYFPINDRDSKKSFRERITLYTGIWLGFAEMVGPALFHQLLMCEGPSVLFGLVTSAGLEILRKRKGEKLFESEIVEIVKQELAEPWRLFNDAWNKDLAFAGPLMNGGNAGNARRNDLLELITPNRLQKLEDEAKAAHQEARATIRTRRSAKRTAIIVEADHGADDADDDVN